METTPAPVKKKSAVSALTLGDADDALLLAKELQRFIKENGLTSNIQGKQFPMVEGWMFAGSLLGLTSLLESIEDRSTADEIKWQAMVTVINTRTGATVGRGFATCSNKEHTKRGFADYAICSMAQTRAVGKAYRLALGWLMKAAGYEATPAEEMDHSTGAADVTPPKDAAVPTMRAVPATQTESALPVQYATAGQKEEVIRLLNHPVITRPEKTKMMLNINRLDEERAIQAIAKLRKAIDDRENSPGEGTGPAA